MVPLYFQQIFFRRTIFYTLKLKFKSILIKKNPISIH